MLASTPASKGNDLKRVDLTVRPECPSYQSQIAAFPDAEMVVSGGVPSLGNWSIAKAHKMARAGDGSWNATVYVPDRGSCLMYHYALVDANADVRWEGPMEKMKFNVEGGLENVELQVFDPMMPDLKVETLEQKLAVKQGEINKLLEERDSAQKELHKLKDIIGSAASPDSHRKRKSYLQDLCSSQLCNTVRDLQSKVQRKLQRMHDFVVMSDLPRVQDEDASGSAATNESIGCIEFQDQVGNEGPPPHELYPPDLPLADRLRRAIVEYVPRMDPRVESPHLASDSLKLRCRPSLPDCDYPAPGSNEQAAKLSCLVEQMRQISAKTPDTEPEKELFLILVEYLGSAADCLRSVPKTALSTELDSKMEEFVRGELLEVMRWCCKAASDSKQIPAVSQLEPFLSDISTAEETFRSMTDVRGKQEALDAVWKKTLAALDFAKQACDRMPALAKTRAGLRSPRLAGSGGAGVGGVVSMLEQVEEGTRRNADAARGLINDRDARWREMRREIEVHREGSVRQVQALEERARGAVEGAEQARKAMEEEVERIMATIATRLPVLEELSVRLRYKTVAAQCVEALRANAEREWRAQTEQMRADEERVEAAGEALKSLMSVVDHFDEGCITVAAHLRRLERSEEHRQNKESAAWLVALARLHDTAWVSLRETQIKNEFLVAEWEEGKEAIVDAIRAAVDRLDALEEGRLTRQLEEIEARVRSAQQRNADLSSMLATVEALFAPVKDALFDGRVGVKLTDEEKMKENIDRHEWAYWIGEKGGGAGGMGKRSGRRLVKSLESDMQAFALRQQQHRLEELRKKHQNGFKQIQRMKQRLASESQKLLRPVVLGQSPSKIAWGELASPNRSLENAETHSIDSAPTRSPHIAAEHQQRQQRQQQQQQQALKHSRTSLTQSSTPFAFSPNPPATAFALSSASDHNKRARTGEH